MAVDIKPGPGRHGCQAVHGKRMGPHGGDDGRCAGLEIDVAGYRGAGGDVEDLEGELREVLLGDVAQRVDVGRVAGAKGDAGRGGTASREGTDLECTLLRAEHQGHGQVALSAGSSPGPDEHVAIGPAGPGDPQAPAGRRGNEGNPDGDSGNAGVGERRLDGVRDRGG
ncbi:MAG: hypothetical protein ACKPEA_06395, partial [Planctomycetota bacterium]